VAILGSISALLFVALAVASLFIETPQPKPANSTQLVVAVALMVVALASLGFVTSIGLFRLQPWARTSILVFAGFVAVGSFFGLLGAMAMPIPPGFSADTARIFRLSVGLVFGVPFAIAIWWLIQFNTQSTKAAFASPMAGAESTRPLSIMVIAWASLAGGASCVFAILTQAPVFLFGAILNGWIAGVIYAVFGALSLYIGKGLLELREEARILGIGWFGFSLIHSSLVILVPSLRGRMLAMQRGLEQNQPNPIPFDQVMMMNVAFAFSAIVGAAAIWFLIRNRAVFGRAEES
jgi:hypothetical protein